MRALVFTVLLFVTSSMSYRDVDFTVEIAAMRRECFFEEAKAGKTMDIEYQVLDVHRETSQSYFYSFHSSHFRFTLESKSPVECLS